MTRVFWDTTLFIYLLEERQDWSKRILRLLSASRERGDGLFTSYLALGEVLAGAGKLGGAENLVIRKTLDQMGFTFLPFGEQAVAPFARLRSDTKVKVADCHHLSCAAAANIDLFLTGDHALTGLHVPGIKFIADLSTNLL